MAAPLILRGCTYPAYDPICDVPARVPDISPEPKDPVLILLTRRFLDEWRRRLAAERAHEAELERLADEHCREKEALLGEIAALRARNNELAHGCVRAAAGLRRLVEEAA